MARRLKATTKLPKLTAEAAVQDDPPQAAPAPEVGPEPEQPVQQQAAAPAEPRRKRGRKRGAPPPSNVSDETRREFYTALLTHQGHVKEATKVLNEARAEMRACFKRARKAGVSVIALQTALAWRNREATELTAELTEINRMAYVAKIPIGTQLGMFDDDATVATKLEQDAAPRIVTKADLLAATKAGTDAGAAGAGATENPHPEGSPLALSWEVGRKDGMIAAARRELAASEASIATPAPTPDELDAGIAAVNAMRAEVKVEEAPAP